jgi:acyl-CoA:acyl-CoA alkyltransferase
MLYGNVCIEGIGHAIPDEIITTSWLEEQIAPVFKKLELDFGLIERNVGVIQRRWWPEDTRFSDAAAMAGEKVLENAGIDRKEIQILISASVCREYWEPANASTIHHKLGLDSTCRFFDVGNACVGFLDAITIIADMIELGRVDTGMVVAAEGSREVTLSTIDAFLKEMPSSQRFYEYLVPLTFGSGSVAMILRHRDKSSSGKSLIGGHSRTASEYCHLCIGDRNWCMLKGRELAFASVELLSRCSEGFQKETGWDDAMMDRYFTHQFSKVGQDLAWRRVGVDPNGRELRTLDWLGNIGAVSCPITMSLAVEQGFLLDGHRVCMIGVGSGLSCSMLAVQW